MSIATPVTLQGGVALFGTTLSVTSVNVLPGSVLTGGEPNGYGTIEGSLTVSGVILPQTAPITVTGDYTQTSSGQLGEQWPQTMAPTYGLLQVKGNATLSGSLYVSTDAPKYPPKTCSTYTVLTFGSLSGEFTSVNTPGLGEIRKKQRRGAIPLRGQAGTEFCYETSRPGCPEPVQRTGQRKETL